MGLDVTANGLTLGTVPSGFDLGDKAKAVFAVPVTANAVGLQTVEVQLTTPDGKVLKKTLTIPVPVSYTHLDVYKRQSERWRYLVDFRHHA